MKKPRTCITKYITPHDIEIFRDNMQDFLSFFQLGKREYLVLKKGFSNIEQGKRPSARQTDYINWLHRYLRKSYFFDCEAVYFQK